MSTRVKWQYSCMDCPGVYEYYKHISEDRWTCPNCGSVNYIVEKLYRNY